MSFKLDSRPVIVLVGGFLGAGKTTLLIRAAQELSADGIRVALITNDQGDDLVDTNFAKSSGVPAGEVTGGCFCCRFTDMVEAARELGKHNPQVILAEPVGSCTDIVATTVRPLEQFHSGEFRIAPFTVLVDPRRVNAFDNDASLSFLFRKQIEEADLLCFTHSDAVESIAPLDGWPLRKLSGRTGEGVRAWLNEVLSGEGMPKHRVMDVDYTVYAEAEAALGWVNWQANVSLRKAASPAAVLGPLFDSIDMTLSEAGVRICHLKGIATARTGSVKASITANGEEPGVDGNIEASPARDVQLLINLRALGDPQFLSDTVGKCSSQIEGNVEVRHSEAFRPSPPKPEKRISA